VLIHLLWSESFTILITLGLFNKLFNWQNNDGFLIDEKIHLQMLLAGDVVVAKVVHGPRFSVLAGEEMR
jgi:hypothetical protein